MNNNLQVITDNNIDTRFIKLVAINGVKYNENFLAGLVSEQS
jgi:hypothetical protein